MAAPLTVFLMVFGLDLTRKFLSDFLPRMINKRGTDERELVDNIKHKKYELSQISPQNEFSKYAKLRRVIDKLQEKAKAKGIEHQKKRIKLKGALWVIGMVLTVPLVCQLGC
ncbi:uncharacterized protein LOC124441082 isoform X2 [Xenia sp. Carnegie-2017]|uniref:uncharacterized protein LOC124441082 isoform X2 n=1 Tax=Xenia sp. Carnegie-2017 TaxID=2897299 RepID=UPI001F0368D6|nr:uncharacterized protein LOC124441082 isoform X2 [Xenia sp. Carnegie-2017]